MINVISKEFNEVMGYFKIKLSNNDNLLLTRKEYGEIQTIDNHKHLMFESTSGIFYKPTVTNNYVSFIPA